MTTLAGNPVSAGFVDGLGTNALFWYPDGVALDKAGNLFVTDESNRAIRKIAPGGQVTTFANLTNQLTNRAPYFPGSQSSLTLDGVGNVYLADRQCHLIQKISPTGTITTLAGSFHVDTNGWVLGGYVDGNGTNALFNRPSAVAVDALGTVYVADTGNHAIRQITADGMVTTLAGNPNFDTNGYALGGYADGIGLAALFTFPQRTRSG